MRDARPAAADLRARVEALPGMDRLLPALAGLAPTYLVGGAVRDLLRGDPSVDLDLVVEGDARGMARDLAAHLGGETMEHERFGTATVRAPDLTLDLATARRERYRSPGALPEVEPASLEADLARRDFTVNAMAISLLEAERGRVHDPHGGLADVEGRTIRVLHRHSFLDDPTRILRGARYEARLGFAMDRDTDSLARGAVGDRALDTVSGDRIGAELMLVLREPTLGAALARLTDLEIDRALNRSLALDAGLAERAAAAAEQVGADRALAALAALASRAAEALRRFVERLGLGAAARDRVLRAARSGPAIADALRAEPSPRRSELHSLLSREPEEALAVALAVGAPPAPVELFLTDLRGARLEISGDDLIAAGVPRSPAIGRALEGALRRKLDGEVAGREEELRYALALARGEAVAP